MGLIGACILMFLVQFIVAIPWASTLGLFPRGLFAPAARRFLFTGLGAAAGFGLLLGLYLNTNNDPKILSNWGRFYLSVLHIQLAMDFFVAAFLFMLKAWPKGGAVALAAFQEGLRQPKYWLLLSTGFIVMAGSTIIPFFTFGEDLKVVKEICYVFAMFMPGIFGILAAGISVAEEIEGRTAVTLMSKPILRRDFLLGKFVGIALAALTMTMALGWRTIWIVLTKDYLDPPLVPVETPDPAWLVRLQAAVGPGSVGDLVRGMGLWAADVADSFPGLLIGFCQVAVLTSLAVALATRVPMIVNVVACMVVYFLGHLTTILTETTAQANPLIRFLAQVIDTVVPVLDVFDAAPAVIRDNPLPPMDYTIYSGYVALYAAMFTAIALLLGLILFEDRDLA